MGTKNDPGQYDCYANAEPDEPMFVLLGRDRDAPLLVELWAALRERAGENTAKVGEARQCAQAMREFREELQERKNPLLRAQRIYREEGRYELPPPATKPATLKDQVDAACCAVADIRDDDIGTWDVFTMLLHWGWVGHAQFAEVQAMLVSDFGFRPAWDRFS